MKIIAKPDSRENVVFLIVLAVLFVRTASPQSATERQGSEPNNRNPVRLAGVPSHSEEQQERGCFPQPTKCKRGLLKSYRAWHTGNELPACVLRGSTWLEGR